MLVNKPRVVALGDPQFAGEEFLAAFKKNFNYSVLEATNYKEAHEKLPVDIRENGPIHAFIIRFGTGPYEPFDEALFDMMAPHLKIVASASAGFNEFPVEYLANKGIYFCNTVDAVAEATADMAIFLTLAALRNTTAAEKSARTGRWRSTPGLTPTRDPYGLTLGIVGLGAIGKHVARKALAFNMHVRYYNRNRLDPEEEARYSATYCPTLHKLLAVSDVVSVHTPLNAQTTGLIDAAAFAAMKDGVFFVNTARGAVVDEPALKAALQSGKVTRAGLDVFCNEPRVDPWFLQQDNVIVQPHLGGLTDVSYQRAERACFDNIRVYYATGKPNSPVLPIKDA